MVPSSSQAIPNQTSSSQVPDLPKDIWGCVRDYLPPDLPLQEAIAEVSQDAMQALAEDWNKQLRWQPSLDRVIRWLRPHADPTDRSQESKVISIVELHKLKRHLLVAEQLKDACSQINEVFQAREEGNEGEFFLTQESRDETFFKAAIDFAKKVQATSKTETEIAHFTKEERIQEWVQRADEIPWFYFVLASVLLKNERELLNFNFSSLETWQINRVAFLCFLQKNPKIELFKKLLPLTSAYKEAALPFIGKFVFTTFLLYAIENKQKEIFRWLLSLQKPYEPNLVLERLAFHNWVEEIPSFIKHMTVVSGFSTNLGQGRLWPLQGLHRTLLIALDRGNFGAFRALRNYIPKAKMDLAMLIHIRDIYQDPAKYQNRRLGLRLADSSAPDHREKALEVVNDVLQKEYSPISEEIQQRISQLIWQGNLHRFEEKYRRILQGEAVDLEEVAAMPAAVAIDIDWDDDLSDGEFEEDEAVRASCFSSLKRYISAVKADPFALALNVFTVVCVAGMAFYAASAYMNREEPPLNLDTVTSRLLRSRELKDLSAELQARFPNLLADGEFQARIAELRDRIANRR